MARIKGWTTRTDEDLFHQFVRNFINEEEAIAHAIWMGNRLVKERAKSTKKKFYSLKDEWLNRHEDCLIEGRIAREEGKTCWDCGGTGTIDEDNQCSSCQGTGKYRTWNLYEHRLEVAGQRYTFHSYVRPKHLSDEPGADCEEYGGRFSEEELGELALPMSGILKILGYVAKVYWGLQFSTYSGRYETDIYGEFEELGY